MSKRKGEVDRKAMDTDKDFGKGAEDNDDNGKDLYGDKDVGTEDEDKDKDFGKSVRGDSDKEFGQGGTDEKDDADPEKDEKDEWK